MVRKYVELMLKLYLIKKNGKEIAKTNAEIIFEYDYDTGSI